MAQDTSECQAFWSDLKSGRFADMVRESSRGETLGNSQELFNILTPLFADARDIEKAFFVFLDAKNKILSIECLFTGSLTASAIYPREVAKRILENGAAAILMAHNHPSGDPEPSADDLAITRKLMMMAKSIGVTMHEHLIIGDIYYSMADRGNIRDMALEIQQLERG